MLEKKEREKNCIDVIVNFLSIFFVGIKSEMKPGSQCFELTEAQFVGTENLEEKCRICLQIHKPLINVCECSGSIGLVHDTCILKWIARKMMVNGQMKLPECQICHKTYHASIEVGPQQLCCRLLVKKIAKLPLVQILSSLFFAFIFFLSLGFLMSFLLYVLSNNVFKEDVPTLLANIFLKVLCQIFLIRACRDHFISRKNLLLESMTRKVEINLQPKISLAN